MIQHRKPFLFVAGLRDKQAPSATVWADFPADNPYLQQPTLPPMLLVEAMAQAVGVFAEDESGVPKVGVLAMLKRVRFLAEAHKDARVYLRVTPTRTFGRLRMFATEAHVEGGAMLATAEIVVAHA